MSNFKFIDLFAGIGGMRIGFDAIGGTCVFTSEWDKFCQQTYQANFINQDHRLVANINDIPVESIPNHDLLLAGFPCQPFSIASVARGRQGFNDPRGNAFFTIRRILEYHKPKCFLLENVSGLTTHDEGRTFKSILAMLTQLGYVISWSIIDASHYVPQRRKRVFIVGTKYKFDFPKLPDLSKPKLSDILLRPEDVDDKYTLTDHLWAYLQNRTLQNPKHSCGLNGPNSITRTLTRRYYKDGKEILIDQPGKNPRRLTPRECSRLMGFDKPQGSNFVIPVSDRQAYMQFGNAVVVPIVNDIAKQMKPYLIGD